MTRPKHPLALIALAVGWHASAQAQTPTPPPPAQPAPAAPAAPAPTAPAPAAPAAPAPSAAPTAPAPSAAPAPAPTPAPGTESAAPGAPTVEATPAPDTKTPTVFPPPVPRPPTPQRAKPQAITVGMHPAAVDFGAEADLVSSICGPKPEPQSRRWNYKLRGFFRAPARVGIGPKAGSTEGSQLHAPPRMVGATSDEWTYIGIAPNPTAQIQLTVQNKRVEGTIILAANTFYDSGYPHLDQTGGFSQAWLTLKSPALFGTKGGLAWSVGAFSERFGTAGPNQESAGYYGTYLFGRTHVAGESLVIDYDINDHLQLIVEHGLGAKIEPIPFIPLNDPEGPVRAPYLPDQGLTPQGSNFLNHAHVALLNDSWLRVAAHFLHSWSPNDNLYPPPQKKAEDASLMVMGGEVHVDHPIAGNGYFGYSHIDAADIMPLSDALQVIHGSTGPVFKEQYFGAQPTSYITPPSTLSVPVDQTQPFDDTGTVDTLLFQYIFRLAPVLGKKREDLDLSLAAFGMFNHIVAPKTILGNTVVEQYTLKQDRLKFGGELMYGPFRFLSIGARFDRVMPDGSKTDVAYSAISPRLVLHSNWLSREYIVLNYTRYFFGSDTYQPSPPYRQPTPPAPPYNAIGHADENVLSLTAMISF
jgi:hypothetical protein